MRDSSTATGQACLSLFGDFCWQTLPPSNYMYLELGALTDASPTLRQSPQQEKTFMPPLEPSNSLKGQRVHCTVYTYTCILCAYAYAAYYWASQPSRTTGTKFLFNNIIYKHINRCRRRSTCRKCFYVTLNLRIYTCTYAIFHNANFSIIYL